MEPCATRMVQHSKKDYKEVGILLYWGEKVTKISHPKETVHVFISKNDIVLGKHGVTGEGKQRKTESKAGGVITNRASRFGTYRK